MSNDEGVTAYRSKPAAFTGVVLLAVGLWLTIDTLVRGSGRTTLMVIGVVLAVGAVVFALTLRAAVFAGPERLVVRNPFRTIEIPWGAIDEVRAEYSLEIRAQGKSFHIWAIPVSLRERKRALRANARATAEDPMDRGHGSVHYIPQAAIADHALGDLRGMAEQFAKESTGDVKAVWYLPVLAPIVVGIVLAAVAAAL